MSAMPPDEEKIWEFIQKDYKKYEEGPTKSQAAREEIDECCDLLLHRLLSVQNFTCLRLRRI